MRPPKSTLLEPIDAGAEPQAYLKNGQQAPDHPLTCRLAPFKSRGLHDQSRHIAGMPPGQQQPLTEQRQTSEHQLGRAACLRIVRVRGWGRGRAVRELAVAVLDPPRATEEHDQQSEHDARTQGRRQK